MRAAVWCQGFQYDAAGNRSIASQPAVLGSPLDAFNFSGGTNQITDTNAQGQPLWNYDAAGNIQQDAPGDQMVYDAEGRMTSLAEKLSVTTAYVYDGEGQRVEQSNALGTTVFVYDAFGNLAAEYATTAPAAAGTQYLVADQLGSTRLVMGSTLERHDYLPFGTETPVSAWQWQNSVPGYGADSFVRWRFAGQERNRWRGRTRGCITFRDSVTRDSVTGNETPKLRNSRSFVASHRIASRFAALTTSFGARKLPIVRRIGSLCPGCSSSESGSKGGGRAPLRNPSPECFWGDFYDNRTSTKMRPSPFRPSSTIYSAISPCGQRPQPKPA